LTVRSRESREACQLLLAGLAARPWRGFVGDRMPDEPGFKRAFP